MSEALSDEMIIERGLPAGAAPKRVVIVGAGMAGLVAGYELKRAGHQVTILESQTRVGGRVLTLREPFSEGLHAEAGAMRIPVAHGLTLAYVNKFGLATAPFTTVNPEAYVRINGQQRRRKEFSGDALSFGLDPHDHERPIDEAWDACIAPLLRRIEQEAWESVTREHDQYSLREFLEANGWSETQIEIFALINHMESLLSSGFLEILREEAGRWFTDVVTLPGGMDQLPRAFLPEVGADIRYGARVRRIEQDASSVTVRYSTAATDTTITADRVIVTVPFSVLRHIEITPPLPRDKQRAIRQLHYDQSVKIFFQARTRHWETEDGIFGGATVTDLPIRAMYYPEHGRETGRGVLLASYTWAQDAERWGALSEQQRISEALENAVLIHPRLATEFEGGATKAWHHDPHAGGAFAMFEPGQETLLHHAILRQEGRLHFAGEHASLAHAWIQGAIDSGLRAAVEVHTAE